jgi:hypothetical protein
VATVYALATQSTAPQSTQVHYDRLGQLDSTVSPGVRPAARKQAYVRDRWGNPISEYPGNGTFIGRTYDWQGRLSSTYHHLVDPSRSVDGEVFADAATKTVYNSFGLTMGPGLSTGQRYWRKYDNQDREVGASGQDCRRTPKFPHLRTPQFPQPCLTVSPHATPSTLSPRRGATHGEVAGESRDDCTRNARPAGPDPADRGPARRR